MEDVGPEVVRVVQLEEDLVELRDLPLVLPEGRVSPF